MISLDSALYITHYVSVKPIIQWLFAGWCNDCRFRFLHHASLQCNLVPNIQWLKQKELANSHWMLGFTLQWCVMWKAEPTLIIKMISLFLFLLYHKFILLFRFVYPSIQRKSRFRYKPRLHVVPENKPVTLTLAECSTVETEIYDSDKNKAQLMANVRVICIVSALTFHFEIATLRFFRVSLPIGKID